MAKPPFMDIRDRALARLDAGETARDVAKALSVALLIGVKWSERLFGRRKLRPPAESVASKRCADRNLLAEFHGSRSLI